MEAAPSSDVHVFRLSEKSEGFCLVAYVGGFSLWKKDNDVCQKIDTFFSKIQIQKIFIFMACGCSDFWYCKILTR